ncbi:receptor-transporting protein 3-like [Anomaloglossus baeobatrachus]|uniref:receptor-transporting protein 3-like n=1 Tax=Anomaloglossus baeobatrachus TaxID=238106 RepID=UPI003F4FB256
MKMENSNWQKLFDNERQNQGIPQKWSFCVDEHLQRQQGYLQYTQHTFASFQCSFCGRRWNSAQVHILFLIRWDAKFRNGTVKMKIFRQSCRRCNASTFEKAEISDENSKRVIINLIIKIQSKIFERKNTRQPLEPEVYNDDMEGPHEKKNCEACMMKVCPWNAVSEGKTMAAVPKPETFRPRFYEQANNFWPTETSVTSRTTRPVYQPQDNEDGKLYIFLLVLLLFAAWLFTLGIKKTDW